MSNHGCSELQIVLIGLIGR